MLYLVAAKNVFQSAKTGTPRASTRHMFSESALSGNVSEPDSLVCPGNIRSVDTIGSFHGNSIHVRAEEY